MALYPIMVITQQGKNLYAKAQSGIAINYTRMRIGSGSYSGDPAVLTDLVQPIGWVPIYGFSRTGATAHVKGRFENTDITQSTYSCEIGIYAQDPDLGEILYGYTNAGTKGDYIPPISAGPFSREFQVNIAVGSASQVTAVISPSGFVTYEEFEDHIKDNVKHPLYGVTTGNVNAYVVTFATPPAAYVDGMQIVLKIHANSNAGPATINVNKLGAKPLKKANGVDATNLKANGIYTFRYNATTGNFILQGEGGAGNATAGDILSGKTASTDEGDISGSMPNRGAVTIIPGPTDQAILNGYHNGSGVVKGVVVPAANVLTGTTIAGTAGTMPNRGTVIIKPTRANQPITYGYHNGAGYVEGDLNLLPENIVTGKTIFGVTGSPKKYYSILGRRVLYNLYNIPDPFSIFAEMLDNGDMLIVTAGYPIMRRIRQDFVEVYNVQLGTDGTYVWLNRAEDCFYYLSGTTLGKRRVSDGGLVWSKTVTSSEKYICGCSTGLFTADITAKKIKKYTLTDGSPIWTSPVTPEVPKGLKATDDGEVFTLGNYQIYKVNTTGTTVSTPINDGYTKNYFEIFSGDNNIWVPEMIGATVKWKADGTGKTELVAASAELGSYTNNDYNAGTIAFGKTRIFLTTHSGHILVFNRFNYSYIDKVPCTATRVAANPNSDNFIAFVQSQSIIPGMTVIYGL
ncbi:hypothetical protein [Brevibacillus sp. SIMBA_040]|uniref:hypothetical protein n=1 Tax=unclassified Brevibacillus TaxID=2684853 RepID=UPI003978B5B8